MSNTNRYSQSLPSRLSLSTSHNLVSNTNHYNQSPPFRLSLSTNRNLVSNINRYSQSLPFRLSLSTSHNLVSNINRYSQSLPFRLSLSTNHMLENNTSLYILHQPRHWLSSSSHRYYHCISQYNYVLYSHFHINTTSHLMLYADHSMQFPLFYQYHIHYNDMLSHHLVFLSAAIDVPLPEWFQLIHLLLLHK